jgi:hypothetical protein
LVISDHRDFRPQFNHDMQLASPREDSNHWKFSEPVSSNDWKFAMSSPSLGSPARLSGFRIGLPRQLVLPFSDADAARCRGRHRVMNIRKASKDYEAWMRRHIAIIKKDLAKKHKLMRDKKSAFPFLRATFYRWAQTFPSLCADVFKAPSVLAVGDIHVENYGTWRDAEGRLNWGINDFDEAYPLPYTSDLTRLATSARLSGIALKPSRICDAILEGYSNAMSGGGGPFVLSSEHTWLRKAVTGSARDPKKYWAKFEALPTLRNVRADAKTLLNEALPGPCTELRIVHRQGGLGSLGRERFAAVGKWNGGWIAREAKALMPSAVVWAGGDGAASSEIVYPQILAATKGAVDPFITIGGGWVVRRLSPYCSRIELADLNESRDEERLLCAMGVELANVHLGSKKSTARVLADLRGRKSKWLLFASKVMAEAVTADWKDWRR